MTASRFVRQLTGAILGTGLAGVACAADLHAGGAINVVSDYVYRGVTQSRGQPAVQLDVHARPLEDWTVGAWASQVELLPGRHSTELNLYTRWRWLLPGELSANGGATYYTYPGDPRAASYHYTELNAGLQWRDRLALEVAWIPNRTLFSAAYGLERNQHGWSADLTTSQRLPGGFVAQAGIGYFDVGGLRGTGYAYGNAGLSRRFGRWRADLTYIWVQDFSHRVYMSGAAGGPWTGSVAWQF